MITNFKKPENKYKPIPKKHVAETPSSVILTFLTNNLEISEANALTKLNKNNDPQEQAVAAYKTLNQLKFKPASSGKALLAIVAKKIKVMGLEILIKKELTLIHAKFGFELLCFANNISHCGSL